MTKVTWQFKHFSQLTALETYEILKVRQEVFMVEQKIYVIDPDDKDQDSWHLFAWDNESNRINAYLRVLKPGWLKYHSLGRVLTPPYSRGQGYGKELLTRAHSCIEENFGSIPLSVSAQCYLEKFYGSFGFVTKKGPYLEDGIDHYLMEYLPKVPQMR